MRKIQRKIKLIALLVLLLFVLFGIDKSSVKLSQKLEDFIENGIVISNESINNSIKDLTNSIFGYEMLNKSYDNTVLEKVRLVRVVDGDTIIVLLDNEEVTVRLIGVDTPESVHSDKAKNNVYGERASEFTKEYLSDYNIVYLQYDKELCDQYGRILAYVWLDSEIDTVNRHDIEEYMYNAILLKEGYAINKEYPPNTAYADVFEQIREDAEISNRGLWYDDDFDDFILNSVQ